MKNNIDKIFNKSLQNYERQPRTEAWEKLQARLEKKDSRVLPLWWKYASAASIALLLGVGGYWFANKNTDSTEQVAISKKPVLKKINEVEKTKEVAKIRIETVVDTISCEIDIPITMPDESEIVNSVAGVPTSPPPSKQIQDLENQNNPVISLETIKIKTPEIKKQTEENTIVLVIENTKPKVEEETIVLNFVETKPEVVAQNIEPEKKQSRVGKIWEQLKRAKNGENVNWNEVGVKPQKVLARADAKIENVLSKGETDN
ncbi:MAG: hypothetical protein U5N85_22475 [Arcicella sp.]|nr:hypothetical protein [Arcicella sp.]